MINFQFLDFNSVNCRFIGQEYFVSVISKTAFHGKPEGWQNGDCAALEKPWDYSLAGSNPAPSAKMIIFQNICRLIFLKKRNSPLRI